MYLSPFIVIVNEKCFEKDKGLCFSCPNNNNYKSSILHEKHGYYQNINVFVTGILLMVGLLLNIKGKYGSKLTI